MGADNAGAPSMAEKQRFLKKIEEWQALGFETDDLEELLENDFDAFLRRRHQILKDQLPDERPSAPEPVEESAPMDTELEPEFESIEDEPVEELEGSPGEGLLLVGEPLAPAPEPDEEPVEEGVIVVGKPKSAPTSKVHRTRREKPEKETPTKETPDTETEDVEDEEELEEEEFDEEEEEEEEAKPTRPPPRAEKPPGTVGGRVAGAIVIIILILAIYYFAIVNPIIDLNGGGGNGGNGGDGEVVAVFDITAADGYFHGSIITFDAFNSEGDITNFRWTLDDDFQITEGTRDSEQFSGYFVTRENIVKKESVTLKVSNDNNENTLTKEIELEPRTFTITEERLGDNGKYQVTGSLNIYNPNGIYVIEEDNYKLKIERVDIDFQSTEQPMTMELVSTGNQEDGFRQTHSVYKRTINQYLDLSGTVRVVPEATDGGLPSPPLDVEITGTMDSIDDSYTDFKTYNTIYGKATNNLDISIPPITVLGQQVFDGTDITRDDTIESYPDLRKNPMNFRIADLADNELEIGEGDAIEVGGVIYHWDAEKVEYFYDSPVIVVNMSINDKTMDRFNLIDFYSEFWIAEDVSQPVKTRLYSVHLQDGTTSVLNYVSEMTDFNPGIQSIVSQDCTEPTGDSHFFDRWPGMTYVPSNNWTFLPPTGKSTRDNDTSFDAFPIEDAIGYAKNNQSFIDYNASHTDSYIVSGYCTATGEWGFSPGTLIWNLTLGNQLDKDALNIVIAEDGSVKYEKITIDQPPNSTSDFEPLLTFAGSEDILNDFSDKAFHDIIFNSGNIDFDQVHYGVQTNLLYPNVDITSISFIERSKYSYLITYDSQNGEQYNSINVALDAETGQLLYYWDYTYSGFQLF